MAFDEWPGLEIACSCTSDAGFSSQYGTACVDERAVTTKCKTLNALPTLFLSVLDGFIVCGKRGGKSFNSAIRPQLGDNDMLACPAETVPCDPSF